MVGVLWFGLTFFLSTLSAPLAAGPSGGQRGGLFSTCTPTLLSVPRAWSAERWSVALFPSTYRLWSSSSWRASSTSFLFVLMKTQSVRWWRYSTVRTRGQTVRGHTTRLLIMSDFTFFNCLPWIDKKKAFLSMTLSWVVFREHINLNTYLLFVCMDANLQV